MTIEVAIFSRLTNDTPVSDLVAARVYPVILPQNKEMPAITYEKVSGERVHAMGSDTGIARPRFRFHCWGDTFDDALGLSTVTRQALQRWRGTESGVEVLSTFIESEDHTYDQEPKTYRVIFDVFISHREA